MDRLPLSAPGRPGVGVLWWRTAFSFFAAALLAMAVWAWFPGYFASFGFGSPIVSQKLPEFTQTGTNRWLNSPPLSVADLRGKVIFLDVWTFG